MTEELKPKPRRGKATTAVADDGLQDIEVSYPGPNEEPPVAIDDEAYLATLEAAVEIFNDDMSPAERSRLQAALDQQNEANIKLVADTFVPRGRVMTDPKGIVEKLIEIMAAVDAVEKKGRNDAQKYNYQRATDVFNAVRPEFIARGLHLTTSIIGKTMTQVTSANGKAQVLYDIDVLFTIRDGREVFEFMGSGSGVDSGDKGLYKAITGAMKYGIRQLLMLPDENDPEVPRSDERPEDPGKPITITAANVSGVKQGGRQTKATSAQIAAIRSAALDLGLTPDGLEAHILSTLGQGPALDPALDPNEQANAILAFLEALSFEDCGKVVKGLVEAVENGGVLGS